MQALSKAAFQVDKFCQTHALEFLWKQNLFSSDLINDQPDSRFMNLPTEIRLMIYKFLSSQSDKPSCHGLAILATCRRVHGEALTIALENISFRVTKYACLKFQSKLQNLGPLQQHLRQVKVQISIEQLNIGRPNNPFVLTNLPLELLDIHLEPVKGNSWRDKNFTYHILISAMLHETISLQTILDCMLLRPWATKTLIVASDKSDKDMLWSAFTHFWLVDSPCSIFRNGGPDGTKHYIMFGDTYGSDENVLEMGRWPRTPLIDRQ
jgi:hypothetical protein